MDLSAATLTGVRTGGITGAPDSLPEPWKLIAGYLIGPSADLTNANLTGADLTGTDLTRSNLAGAVLEGANLAEVYLYGATLSATKIGGSDLSATYLSGVVTRSVSGVPSGLPSGWEIRCGVLFGPGSNLSKANLSKCSLKSANLTGVTFSSPIGSAMLTGVSSGSVKGTPSKLPSGWGVAYGFVIGPGANLKAARLVGLNLTARPLSSVSLKGADLSGANLTGANLGKAALAGTNLTKADLSKVNLAGVKAVSLIGKPKALPRGFKLVRGAIVKG